MRWIGMAAAALALGGCMASAEQQAAQQADADHELAELIGNRVAGEPVDCITVSNATGGPTIIDGGRIAYRDGGRLYVNNLAASCPSLRPLDTLIVEMRGSQLCRNDRVRSVQPGNSIPGPFCILGKFTPYTAP